MQGLASVCALMQQVPGSEQVCCVIAEPFIQEQIHHMLCDNKPVPEPDNDLVFQVRSLSHHVFVFQCFCTQLVLAIVFCYDALH